MSLMDDVTYVVKLPEAQMLLEALPAILEGRGFKVNLSKAQIYKPDGRAKGHSRHDYIHARLDGQLLSPKQKAQRVIEDAIKHTEGSTEGR